MPLIGFQTDLEQGMPCGSNAMTNENRGERKQTNRLARREFLIRTSAGSALLFGGGLSEANAFASQRPARAVIQLNLVGGPSQLETWDPKPDAPSAVRSPFSPIATTVPGIQICETFPRMARLAHRFSLVRTLHHDEAPIHETGLQLVQTGRFASDAAPVPHIAATINQAIGMHPTMPSWVVLPHPLGDTGVDIPQGQDGGTLGRAHDPCLLFEGPDDLAYADRTREGAYRWMNHQRSLPFPLTGRGQEALDLARETRRTREEYGRHSFGQSCLVARRLVEAGVRFVTVNMFETVFQKPSWDMHAYGGSLPTDIASYRREICPMFDQGFTALLADLVDRRLLDEVLVVATGELGRTPKWNPRGGRDHWPGCWTGIVAGGGTRGGRVIGQSDSHAAEPKDRPVTPGEWVATVRHAVGLADAQTSAMEQSRGPIAELF